MFVFYSLPKKKKNQKTPFVCCTLKQLRFNWNIKPRGFRQCSCKWLQANVSEKNKLQMLIWLISRQDLTFKSQLISRAGRRTIVRITYFLTAKINICHTYAARGLLIGFRLQKLSDNPILISIDLATDLPKNFQSVIRFRANQNTIEILRT